MIELTPVGITCNLSCKYCFEDHLRDKNCKLPEYNFDKVKKSIIEMGDKPFRLHGGEPLLLSKEKLEELFYWGYQNHGKNSIQTNGTLIDQDHIELFKKYKVSVGVSIDGDGELNDYRWKESVKKTRENTLLTIEAIRELCKNRVPVAVITSLHNKNASRDRLEKLISWFKFLDSLGVQLIRLNILNFEKESQQEMYGLSYNDLFFAFKALYKIQKEFKNSSFDKFDMIKQMLIGKDIGAICDVMACDPYTTLTCSGMRGNGETYICNKGNQEGIDFNISSEIGYERYISLYNTGFNSNGCKGCRFFIFCKGQCPGSAINNDWRNRSSECFFWKKIYAFLEEEVKSEGLSPISLDSKLRVKIETIMVDGWKNGYNIPIEIIIKDLNLLWEFIKYNQPSEYIFNRTIWKNKGIKNVWEPRFKRLSELFLSGLFLEELITQKKSFSLLIKPFQALHINSILKNEKLEYIDNKYYSSIDDISIVLIHVGVPIEEDSYGKLFFWTGLAVRNEGEIIKILWDLEYKEEASWISELLDYSVNWSDLHGISLIKTPLLFISRSCDYTDKSRERLFYKGKDLYKGFKKDEAFVDSILLIGPKGAGKSSVGSRLSMDLNMPFVNGDKESWSIFREISEFRKCEDIVKAKGSETTRDIYKKMSKIFLERLGERKAALFKEYLNYYLIKSLLKKFPGSIIELGAYHLNIENKKIYSKTKKLLSSYKNIILLLPSNSIEDNIKILENRIKHRIENRNIKESICFEPYDQLFKNYFDIATNIVYCNTTIDHACKKVADVIVHK